MNSKNPTSAVVSRMIAKRRKNHTAAGVSTALACWSFKTAADEIAQALNITYDAAMMTLYGLAATGNVRFLDDDGKVVEEDECTISEFASKARFFVAEDVRHWLKELSPLPQLKQRDIEIEKRLPRRIPWKPFCDEIRDACNGWRAPGMPAWGFGDKQIKRLVKDLTGE